MLDLNQEFQILCMLLVLLTKKTLDCHIGFSSFDILLQFYMNFEESNDEDNCLVIIFHFPLSFYKFFFPFLGNSNFPSS